MGETGAHNFEKSMVSDLMGYQGIVDRWLKVKFPGVYSQAVAFDCHSAGMLDILEKGYTGICPEERQHMMFKRAIEHVRDVYKDIKLPDKVRDGYYTRGSVDFAKLDPAFINSLPLTRRRVWKLRCEGKKIREIAEALKMTVNNVCVYCYYLRQSYVRWMQAKQAPRAIDLEQIPDNRHYRYIAQRRYVDGYAVSLIAEELGITPGYVRVVMHRVKALLNVTKT
jgi:DNA-binding NarL/FixJ family response regulator